MHVGRSPDRCAVFSRTRDGWTLTPLKVRSAPKTFFRTFRASGCLMNAQYDWIAITGYASIALSAVAIAILFNM